VFQLEKLALHAIESDKPLGALPAFTAEQLSALISEDEDIGLEITKFEEQLNGMKPNIAAIAEYRKKVIVCFLVYLWHKLLLRLAFRKEAVMVHYVPYITYGIKCHVTQMLQKSRSMQQVCSQI
jgi:hypothetical protein